MERMPEQQDTSGSYWVQPPSSYQPADESEAAVATPIPAESSDSNPAYPSARIEPALPAASAHPTVLSKLVQAAKVALPPLSAVVSFVIYALLFGWQFGLGLVVVLFVHEMGHFVVIRAKGLPANLPIFIPLLGAYVAMRRMPHDARDEAEIALAGPLVGALGGGVCLLLLFATGQRIFLPLAFLSFLLNLINLVPVSPLDGGRVVGAISRWVWPLGLVLVAAAFFYSHNVLLLVLLFLGFAQTLSRFRATPTWDAYYKVSAWTRAYITVVYVGLAVVLALGIYLTQMLARTAVIPF